MAYLNGWKEFARYIGRGVRTVQRWEHDLGLPVHRPKGADRSAVLASTEELDLWLRLSPRNPPQSQAKSHNDATTLADYLAEKLVEQQKLWMQSRALRATSCILRADHIAIRARNRELRSSVRQRARFSHQNDSGQLELRT